MLRPPKRKAAPPPGAMAEQSTDECSFTLQYYKGDVPEGEPRHYGYRILNDDMKSITRAYFTNTSARAPRFSDQLLDEAFLKKSTDHSLRYETTHPDNDGVPLKLYVKYTKAKGFAVFAGEEIQAGQFLTSYFGRASSKHPGTTSTYCALVKHGRKQFYVDCAPVDGEGMKEWALGHLFNSVYFESPEVKANALIGTHGDIKAVSTIQKDNEIQLSYAFYSAVNKLTYVPKDPTTGDYNTTVFVSGERSDFNNAKIVREPTEFFGVAFSHRSENAWTALYNISDDLGLGLFAARPFFKGETIAQFIGGTFHGMHHVNQRYAINLSRTIGKARVATDVYIDPTKKDNDIKSVRSEKYAHQGAHFINCALDERNANCEFVQMATSSDVDDEEKDHVIVVATKNIATGEQILEGTYIRNDAFAALDHKVIPPKTNKGLDKKLVGTYYGYVEMPEESASASSSSAFEGGGAGALDETSYVSESTQPSGDVSSVYKLKDRPAPESTDDLSALLLDLDDTGTAYYDYYSMKGTMKFQLPTVTIGGHTASTELDTTVQDDEPFEVPASPIPMLGSPQKAEEPFIDLDEFDLCVSCSRLIF